MAKANQSKESDGVDSLNSLLSRLTVEEKSEKVKVKFESAKEKFETANEKSESGVVYQLQCDKKGCSPEGKKGYVGQTGREVEVRIKEHERDIRKAKDPEAIKPKKTDLVKHFAQEDHSSKDLKVTLLRQNLPEKDERKAAEKELIESLDTKLHGLNMRK